MKSYLQSHSTTIWIKKSRFHYDSPTIIPNQSSQPFSISFNAIHLLHCIQIHSNHEIHPTPQMTDKKKQPPLHSPFTLYSSPFTPHSLLHPHTHPPTFPSTSHKTKQRIPRPLKAVTMRSGACISVGLGIVFGLILQGLFVILSSKWSMYLSFPLHYT